MLLLPLLSAGKSPHVRFRPSEIEIGFADVRGMDVVLEEVVRTLNLFLGFKTFRETMGGTPRRGVLFEGPPGTGKTYMAKALAKEAGVPFFYVSSSAFQSMYYGQTNRKIRSYFKELRKAARAERAAPSASSRRSTPSPPPGPGMRMTGAEGVAAARRTVSQSQGKEGIAGIVNELLIQLQSFDHPTKTEKLQGFFVDRLNNWLPDHRQLSQAPLDPGQRPHHRGHQPGRRPRPGPAPPRPVRPFDPLRPPQPVGPAGDHRLLPRPQGPRRPSSTGATAGRRWPP